MFTDVLNRMQYGPCNMHLYFTCEGCLDIELNNNNMCQVSSVTFDCFYILNCTAGGALAEGFQARMFEFQNFERRFEVGSW